MLPDFSELAFNSSGNIANQLYDRLKRMVISGRLPPGYVFPCESELCETLSVGRTTLREAYKALEATGYITRTKRGTYVNGEEQIASTVPFCVALEESDYNDLTEFRAIIESQIAGLAADRAQENNLANLCYYYNKMCQHQDDLHKITYFDTQFHMELARASNNQLLQKLMLMSCDVFASGVYKAFTVDTAENIRQALIAHERILGAIEHHEHQLACDAMFEHLHTIQSREVSWSERYK